MQHQEYQVVIGLEVHAQMSTESKLFCADETGFGAAPNHQVSEISLAHPGTLPVLNEKVLALAAKLGIALDCDIAQQNYFARKNYFYPDLPKGYQISQHTEPICTGGFLSIDMPEGAKKILLNRIHIEEDAGKSMHDAKDDYSLIDLNRAGIPLLEIVTEPVMHSADEAYQFLTELRRLVRWLEVCDGNMEQGSLRCDANISVRPMGSTTLGTRVEVKNLNSIRNVKRAILIEAERLVQLTQSGKPILQETRGYDADTDSTYSLRNKEEAEDYRYFPEPDLPPVHISTGFLEEIKNSLPELPQAMKTRLVEQCKLSVYDADQICSDKPTADFFNALAANTDHYKSIVNWIIGPLKSYANDTKISLDAFPVEPLKLAELIRFTDSGAVHFGNAGSILLPALIQNPAADIENLASSLNLLQNKDEERVGQWIDEILDASPEQVKAYRMGKKGLLGYFAGELKKKSKGKADMQLAQVLLQQKLNT